MWLFVADPIFKIKIQDDHLCEDMQIVYFDLRDIEKVIVFCDSAPLIHEE